MEKAAKQPWLKPLVFAAALSPLLWLASRAVRGTLGPDPVAEVLNRLGLYAISLLFCSLACTPLQIVLGLFPFPPPCGAVRYFIRHHWVDGLPARLLGRYEQ